MKSGKYSLLENLKQMRRDGSYIRLGDMVDEKAPPYLIEMQRVAMLVVVNENFDRAVPLSTLRKKANQI